jgi:hypothetical protein
MLIFALPARWSPKSGCVESSSLTRRFTGRAMACLLWLAFVFCAGAASDIYQPGQVYYGRSNYIEYIAGDMPVIFSVPHGGSLTPVEIPDRRPTASSDDFATVTDANTEELGLEVARVFRRYFGHSPHLIICRLQRTKLDCNREIGEAAAGNGPAEQAWKEFHGFINAASNSVIKSTGRGFYVDLHGQSHPIKRVELGYLLKPWQLTNSDAVLDQPAYAAQSSIRTLAAQVPIPFSQLLRGSNSLGALLLSNGYPAVPSPAMPSPWANRNPDPTSGAPSDYFDGGFNTRMHGSIRQGGGIDGVQMEVNLAGLRDTAANRSKFAAALAQAMDVFFARNFVIDLRSSRSLSAGVSKQVELHSDATSLPRRRSPVENPL